MKKTSQRSILILLLFGLLIWEGYLNRGQINETIITMKNIFFNTMPTYQERLCFKVGKSLCSFYDFINRNTDRSSTILIPPQGYPWPATGNIAYSRYFLYPRKLINGNEKDSKVNLKEQKVTYVLIDWGENNFEYGYTNGWPKFNLPAKRILFEDGEIIYRDYDSKDPVYVGKRGLIEIDRSRL